MRRTSTFSIEGRSGQFTVYELTLKELKLLLDPQLQQLPAAELFTHLIGTFLPLCSNIPRDIIDDLAPSELDFIWEKFREVNQTFFGMPRRLGITDLLEHFKPILISTFGGSIVSWLKRATSTPPTTDTASSSPPTASTTVSSEFATPNSPSP